MNRSPAVALLILALIRPASGGPPSEPLQAVAVVDGGTVKLTYPQFVPKTVSYQTQEMIKVPKTVEVKELVNGEEVVKQKIVEVDEVRIHGYDKSILVPVWKTVELIPNSTRYFEMTRQPIDAATLSRRLAKPTPVVLVQNGKPLADYYAGAFKPGTLVVSTETPLILPALIESKEQGTESPAATGTEEEGEAPVRAEPEKKTVPGVAEEGKAEPMPTRVGELLLPTRPAPLFVFASIDGAGKLSVRQLQESTSEQTAVREVSTKVEGRQILEKVPFTMILVATTNIAVKFDPVNARFSQADGRAVAPDRLASVLTREQTAVMSSDGEPADPFWLKALNRGVLVVQAPPSIVWMIQSGGYYGAESMPAPAADDSGLPTPAGPKPGES